MQQEHDFLSDRVLSVVLGLISIATTAILAVRWTWAALRKPIFEKIEAEQEAREELARTMQTALGSQSLRSERIERKQEEVDQKLHDMDRERLESLVSISTRLGTIEGLLRRQLGGE